MDDYYDNIAHGYDELYEKEQLEKLDMIKDNLDLKKTDNLLDIGCGTGISTRIWKCKKTGIDPSEELLKIARKKDPQTRYIKARAENIPFKDKEFDIVLSLTAIQNFDDIEKSLKEIKRVGKKRFILTFLKKSDKRKLIEKSIKNMFETDEILEENKDIIYFCR